MMKNKILLLVILLVTFSAFVLTSCNKNKETDKVEHIYFIDGIKSDSAPSGNFVYYVKTIDNKFYHFDRETKSVESEKEDMPYTLYSFSVQTLYDSVANLKADETLKEGDKVGVKSYYEGNNRGEGIWKIIASGNTANGDFKLQNGLFATLIPFEIDGKKVVTVDQLGAKADGKTADQKYINYSFKTDADIVEFEGETYLQTDTILLKRSNITLDGKGAQIKNKYKNGTVNYDLSISGTTSALLKNVTVQNLELYCSEEQGTGALYNKADHMQISTQNTENLTIKNCRLITPEEGDNERHVCTIWSNGIINGLTIEDNYVFNYSDSGMGGGIWISTSAKSYDDAAKNIVVRNNKVIKNSCDEVFAIFIGYFDGVLVENNYFETKDHFFTSDGGGNNGIGIGVYDCETHCKNVKFLNNEVRLCLKNTAFIFSDSENIEIAGNKVYVNEGMYGTPSTKKFGLNNLFRMVRKDDLTSENCNVVNLNVHDNYFEVTVGKVIDRNYDMLCLELGIKSGDFINNEFVINGRLSKILDDKINFTGNKITVNGSLANNNTPEGNTVVVNEK